jgi:phage terminase Nu1 subunit (DNA packaging protein)
VSLANLDAMSAVSIAEALGVTKQTVYNWLKNDGLPCSDAGKSKTVRLRDLLDWYAISAKREAVKSVKSTPSDTPAEVDESYEEALCRKTKAEANLKELQLARARGQVASIADVEKVLNASVKATQTQVLAVPSRLATRILGLEDHAKAVAILSGEMNQLLTNLADIDAFRDAAHLAADEDDE